MMVGLHDDNGGADVSEAAAEFAMMGISPKAYQNVVKNIRNQKNWYHKTQIALEEKIRILSANLENTTNTLSYTEKLHDQAQKEKKEWEVKWGDDVVHPSIHWKLILTTPYKSEHRGKQVVMGQNQRTYASCDSSLKNEDKDFPPAVDIKTLPELYCDFYNCIESVPCKSKAASVPAGSRNSPASVTAGGSDPAASRNKPAVNSAGRPNPAGWSKRPAPVLWDNGVLLLRPQQITLGGIKDHNFGGPRVMVDLINPHGFTLNDPQGRLKSELAWVSQVKGGIVKFGGGDGRISGKGTIRTSKLDLVSITNPHNKTPYELISGKVPQIADEGYLVGYAPNSKAYRVYNLTNKRVEETMNLRFLEDKPNVQGIGHEWYFDLDYLTDSLGYTRFKTDKPAGTQETNINAGTQDHDSDSEVDEQVIVVPSFPSNSFAGPSSSNGPGVMERNADYAEELAKLQRQEYEAKDAAARYGYLFSQETAEILSQAEAEIRNQGVSADRDPAGIDSAGGVSAGSTSAGSLQPAGSYEPTGKGNPAVSTSVSADFIPVHADESTLPPGQSLGSSENTTRFPVPSDVCKDQLSSGIFTSSSYDDDFSATLTNLAPAVEVNPVPTKRVNTIHPQSQIIGDLASPVLTRSRAQKSKFGESAFIGYIQDQQRTNHTDQLHCLDANEKNLIQVLKIHTDDNVADLLTKAFDGPRFEYLVVHIGMVDMIPAMDYADGSVFMLVGILLLVDSFLLMGFLLADLFLLVVTCFCCLNLVSAVLSLILLVGWSLPLVTQFLLFKW
ncbi:hypothetical protein Tco_1406569 [Tanacetum coccineum]